VAVGRQITDNFSNTGFFNNTETPFSTPLSNPTIAVPITFRQSATDADNHSTATSLSVYGESQLFRPARRAASWASAESKVLGRLPPYRLFGVRRSLQRGFP
jgi:hypothetical protein